LIALIHNLLPPLTILLFILISMQTILLLIYSNKDSYFIYNFILIIDDKSETKAKCASIQRLINVENRQKNKVAYWRDCSIEVKNIVVAKQAWWSYWKHHQGKTDQIRGFACLDYIVERYLA